jgi:hypothetical protein
VLSDADALVVGCAGELSAGGQQATDLPETDADGLSLDCAFHRRQLLQYIGTVTRARGTGHLPSRFSSGCQRPLSRVGARSGASHSYVTQHDANECLGPRKGHAGVHCKLMAVVEIGKKRLLWQTHSWNHGNEHERIHELYAVQPVKCL